MTGQSMRLAQGGCVDRSQRLNFEFDGVAFEGFAGDTLASALLANSVRIVGRSFKLHRPRGVFGSWSEEPNALVQTGEGSGLVPNLKATQVELFDGLKANSVNCWPSARFDVFAALSLLKPFMPAGFYYKTFMWPHWHWFEPLIRRAAGLGVAPAFPDTDRYEERHEHCDVLIVGAGPAGLSAAVAAVRAGARVVLVDERPHLGGTLRSESHAINGQPALQWVAAVQNELQSTPRIRILKRTTAFGFYDHQLVALAERIATSADNGARERLWHVRANEVIIAAGAIERPIVFPDNDVPGVMLASAAMNFAVQYAVLPGRRAVFITSCDSAYEAALALQARGVNIVAMVDSRSAAADAMKLAESGGLRLLAGYGPVRVHGSRAVRGIEVGPLESGGRRWLPGATLRLECDLVCVCGGWTPTLHLFSQAGGQLRYDADRAALIPAMGPAGVHCAGAACGRFSLDECLTSGFEVGLVAARATGAVSDSGVRPITSACRAGVASFWSSPPAAQRNAWVDLQNDVTRADLELAVRENLHSVEHVKRYTTVGMAVDQGKTSNMNVLGLLAEMTDRPMAERGTTTFRPPYDPVTLGTLAARRVGGFYHPVRHTPMDEWHRAHGAIMEDFGGWRRPAWYAHQNLSRSECVREEKRATRSAISLFDGSPLGKLEVRGTDAATFLNRMYYNNMSTLAVGQVRYGIMLNEHGIIIDDGVCMRLAENHFLVSTTSSGASRIFAHFEDWLQCEWRALQVLVTNVTSAWGIIAVAGPRARELLQRLDTNLNLQSSVFPHLSVRSGHLCDVPARIARVGYSGELSYEIYVPAGYAANLWEVLLRAGQDLGAAPLGVDALQELRTEKGFIHVGSDTDGRTIPADIGLAAAMGRKSSDFVGRRSLTRADAVRPDRLQFVGIAADDPLSVLPIGAHVRNSSVESPGSDGYVTSSCASEAVGRSVALGLVRAGRQRLDEPIQVYSQGQVYGARIVTPGWYDPGGARLHA